MPIQVIQEFIAEGRGNRPGTFLKPTSITIHNTDNTSKGAGAKAHSGFVRNTGYYMLNGKKHWVSWHYTVDDRFIIQHLPLNERAWHAGPGNAGSVAIEICMNADLDAGRAYENAAALVASLLTSLGLKLKSVVTHQSWTGKKCPRVLLEGDSWDRFLDLVGSHLENHSFSAELSLSQAEVGSADSDRTVAVDDLEYDIDHDLLAAALAELEDDDEESAAPE